MYVVSLLGGVTVPFRRCGNTVSWHVQPRCGAFDVLYDLLYMVQQMHNK